MLQRFWCCWFSVIFLYDFALAWETCCTNCNGGLVCNGQSCSGVFQACANVLPGPTGSCQFQWQCKTSAWRIAVFVIALIIGIGAILIGTYLVFRWISYRKLSRYPKPHVVTNVSSTQPHAYYPYYYAPNSSVPTVSSYSSSLTPTYHYSYVPSAPPPSYRP
eukprot:jgi/Galph1/3286/GphlegSOOS_G1997.1